MEAVYADRIYTGKQIRERAYLKFNGNTILGISAKAPRNVLASYRVITPAFIDPHSHIGLHRAGEPSEEGEGNEKMDSVLLLADALDSLQMDDPALTEAVELGVLYSCILPGSGNIVGGRSAVIRNWAGNSNDALVCRAGIKGALGYNPMSTKEWKGKRATTRMGNLAILRDRLEEVRTKMATRKRASAKKRSDITFSAGEKVLQSILEGKQTFRIHVHKIDDIAALIRLVDAFNVKVTVEHAMDVHEPEIFVQLKKAGIPVVYGPLDGFAYKVELRHEHWRNVRHLMASGVRFGLMTDHPVVPARNLLLQTRWFIRCGMSKQDAIELISRKNAEILGIDRLGTLQKGRWASFVCWNGDPFDLSSYPVAVFGEGKRLYRSADNHRKT